MLKSSHKLRVQVKVVVLADMSVLGVSTEILSLAGFILLLVVAAGAYFTLRKPEAIGLDPELLVPVTVVVIKDAMMGSEAQAGEPTVLKSASQKLSAPVLEVTQPPSPQLEAPHYSPTNTPVHFESVEL